MRMIGFIYCIECLETGNKYYGSTVKTRLTKESKDHCARHTQLMKMALLVVFVSRMLLLREGNYTASVVKEVEFE